MAHLRNTCLVEYQMYVVDLNNIAFQIKGL